MANRVTRRPPLSPSVYLASGSHSSTTTFSNHTPAKGTFSWQWPKWGCELDAFCNSAKKVIRDLGSVLQPDHDELERCGLNYSSRSGLDIGIGASEVQGYFQGVGDSESNGGYLSDGSPDYSHGPAQLSFTACTSYEVEVEPYHPPRRASPRFSEGTDSTASLAVAAYSTEIEYLSDEEEEGRYLEERGRPLCGDMAGTVITAPIREGSGRRDKSLHRHEDPGERERRRAERRKRKLEKEERKSREALEERERVERRQERQERHERRKQRDERAHKPEVPVKEKTPKLTIEEYLSGFGGFVCRFNCLLEYWG